jgi:tryptophan synthase alpha chain
MSRIQQLFKKTKRPLLNIYCTAGYPRLESTLEVMQALQNNKVDLIELGMPYSDPLADGPVIQESSAIAIGNGMSIYTLFSQLKSMRPNIKLPVILMGYMNPVLQFGFEKFCEKAATVGIDGLIIPDLPMHEFETEYASIIKKYNLNFIFLVTPETTEHRIRQIDKLSTGFLYAVSSSSTTGGNTDITLQETYFERLQSLKLNNPILIGFGIKDKATFQSACKYTNGAIIGTAYIKALTNADNIETATENFLSPILS